MTHEEDVCEVGVIELEMPLVVELEESRAVGVVVLEVHVVALRLSRGVAALLAHVHLRAALLVGVAVLDAVHLEAMRLEGAALREGLLAQVTLVRTHTCVGAGVALKVKGVIEAFAAESAQVTLDVRVALHMAVEESLQAERFRAHATHELAACVIIHHNWLWLLHLL